jgi:hypothetical protein
VLESVWASLLCPAIGVMVIAALLTTLAFFLATVKAIDNGLGLTPPRGWRSCKPFFLSVSNSAASSSLVCIFLDLVSGGCCCALLLPSLSSSAHRVRCRTQQLTAAPPASCLLPLGAALYTQGMRTRVQTAAIPHLWAVTSSQPT